MQLPIPKIQSEHRFNRIRDLLAIRSNILHRRAAYTSGDAAQAFNAGTIVGYDQADKFVPVFACAGFEYDFLVTMPVIDPGNSDFERQARPASVRDHEVTAPAENKKWKIS